MSYNYLVPLAPDYLKDLAARKKITRVYSRHQLLGLEIAKLLGDESHKSLYIKLAKKYPAGELMSVARDVAERRGIRKKGAYFMRIITSEERNDKGKNLDNRR